MEIFNEEELRRYEIPNRERGWRYLKTKDEDGDYYWHRQNFINEELGDIE